MAVRTAAEELAEAQVVSAVSAVRPAAVLAERPAQQVVAALPAQVVQQVQQVAAELPAPVVAGTLHTLAWTSCPAAR